jgi:hypothetical protein
LTNGIKLEVKRNRKKTAERREGTSERKEVKRKTRRSYGLK